MNRRKLLSAGSAVMVLAGAAAGVAVAAAATPLPSPILDAARRIAVLNQQHDETDVPGAHGAELDRIWCLIWSQERFILAATPTTVIEAMVIMMVAAGNLDTAARCEAAHAMAMAAMSATGRATRYLAGAAGVDVAEFGGDLYLPADVAPPCLGRAA